VKPVAQAFGALAALAFAREGTAALAQGNLTRQPTRAAVTASATMIGLAIIVAIGGMTTSLTGGFLGVMRKSLGSDYLFVPPSIAVWQGNVGADEDLAEQLRAVRGVAVVSTMRYAGTTVNGKPVSLLGIDPATFPQVAGLNFQAGDERSAYAALARGRALIINGPFASQTGLKVGETVRLATPTGARLYQVAAIAGDYLNAKILTAYISQANLRLDFRKTEDIFVQLNLAPGADPAVVEPKIKAIAADYPQFSMISGRTYYEENRQIFDAMFGMMYALFVVLALPSLIAMLNTLAIGVIERTREIGMLRAIGSTRSQVRRMVVTEALLLAALGTAFGILAGLYLGYVMITGLSVGGFPVAYSFPLAGILAGIAIGLLFGVLAAFLPARQAAGLEIVRALRYE
jgi:putative ABC transport system permease protein